MKSFIVLLLLSIDVLLAQNKANSTVRISNRAVARPRSMSGDFWTPERLKAAKNLLLSHPIIAPAQVVLNVTSPLARALNSRGRHVATTGRAFLVLCGDLIVTTGHCLYETSTSRSFTDCNWIFVPGYENGTAPYSRWPARLAAYAFGNPVNLDNGKVLQSCSGTPGASKYTGNNYVGQGLSNCYMTGGCSGGPWLQQFDESTGVGVTYSVNSFTYSSVSNTINGPVFDTNVYNLWNYTTAP
ncbi:unnamed protein product [Adineta ricciae]|uniref:Serine protease n=1 Tax=Adineta ricciae TaxID=249248 RepID=A0A815SW79_ADIRI|nr:unnamed protein product [Adineta ricciae]CAF1495645.1 unnamed protein product [Adineta ricciae]